MRARTAAVGLVALVALASPTRGTAQRLTGVLSFTAAEHRVDAGTGLEPSSGPLFGAGVQVAIAGRWTLGLESVAGSLTAKGGGPDRDLSELRTTLRFRALSWLHVETEFGTRVYTAAIASQRWTVGSLGAAGTLEFAGGHMEGVGRFALIPMVGVTDLAGPHPGVKAAAGMRLHFGAAAFGLLYGLERYDFAPVAGIARRERLSTLTLQATWTPGAH